MKTQSELLALFPDYKPTVYYSNSDNDLIIPVFTYWDRIELEERLLSPEEIEQSIIKRDTDRLIEHNKDNQQGLLFIS